MTQAQQKEKEFKAFLEEYKNGEKLEAPTLFTNIYNCKCATLQFCGWSISLFPDGTYFFNDTTGG